MTDVISSVDCLRDYPGIGTGIKAVIFDYGGTLDSHGDHWSHIILDGYRRAGINVPVESFKDAYIYAERALEKEALILPADTFRETMEKKIRLQFRRLNLGEDPKPVADYCYHFARQCVEESRPTLEYLAGRVSLALVSNFYGNLHAVISDFGIIHCFTTIVESAAVGIRKPDPEIFRIAIGHLRQKAAERGFGMTALAEQEILVVGDSMKNDILPALALGCRAVRYPGRQWPPE